MRFHVGLYTRVVVTRNSTLQTLTSGIFRQNTWSDKVCGETKYVVCGLVLINYYHHHHDDVYVGRGFVIL